MAMAGELDSDEGEDVAVSRGALSNFSSIALTLLALMFILIKWLQQWKKDILLLHVELNHDF